MPVGVRLLAFALVGFHSYIHFYEWWGLWGLTDPRVEEFLLRFADSAYVRSVALSYWTPILLLALATMADRVKRSDKVTRGGAMRTTVIGLGIYASALGARWIGDLLVSGALFHVLALVGFAVTSIGMLDLKRVLGWSAREDIFNEENQSFPQETRKIDTPESVNLPMTFRYDGKRRKGWINVVNPYRGTTVMGTPGSGKTFAVVKEFIRQLTGKGFAMYVYDYKFPGLTVETYNSLLRNVRRFERKPAFCVINFDDLERSHRCNPIHPDYLEDYTDATESATTILQNLNPEYVKHKDFWANAAIAFTAAVIWYLRSTENGRYCTLPHAIEFIARPYEEIFPILASCPAVATQMASLASNLQRGAVDQLEGVAGTTRTVLGRLISPRLYWVLTGNDFSLELNDPREPKVLCIGNNPKRQQTYGPVLALFNSRVLSLINHPGRVPMAVIIDELPTVYLRGLDDLIATGRENRIATLLAFQDRAQLVREYTKDVAEATLATCANVFSGQVKGEAAEKLARSFGKTVQERKSVSQNRTDTSYSKSTQLQERIPASRIENLSQGEFVGSVADTRKHPIDLKVFDARIELDAAAIDRMTGEYVPVPKIRDVTQEQIEENDAKVRREVLALIERHTPAKQVA